MNRVWCADWAKIIGLVVVFFMVVSTMTAPADATATAEKITVEGDADSDGDGKTGSAETDDGDAVYGSLEAGLRNVAAGGTVTVQAGTYGNVTIKTPRITVVGREGATIVLDRSTVGIHVTEKARGVTIEGITISNAYRGLVVDAPNVTARDITVNSSDDYGVLVRSNSFAFQNSVVTNNGEVTGFESARSGVKVIDANSVTINATRITNNRVHGLLVQQTDTVSLTDVNLADNDGAGAHVVGARSIVVRGSTLTGNTGEGLAVLQGSGRSRTVSITNTTIRNNDEWGLRLGGTPNDDSVRLVDLDISENGEVKGFENRRDGVRITDFESITLHSLEASANKDSGIEIHSPGAIVNISAVTVVNNQHHGIDIGGAKTARLRAASIRENGNSGIRIDGSAPARAGRSVVLTNTTVSSNGAYGLRVIGTDSSDSVSVTGVVATDNGKADTFDNPKPGIVVTGTEQVNLTSLAVHGNFGGGVAVRVPNSTTFTGTVTNVSISEINSGVGLELKNPKAITIQNATITGGSDGIQIYGSAANGRTVTIENTTASSHSARGIEVIGTLEPDTLTLRNVAVSSNGKAQTFEDPRSGVFISKTETIRATNVSARKNARAGLLATAGSKISIRNGSFTGNKFGILLQKDVSGDGTTIRFNVISDNTESGIKYLGSGTVDARRNDWNGAVSVSAPSGTIETTPTINLVGPAQTTNASQKSAGSGGGIVGLLVDAVIAIVGLIVAYYVLKFVFGAIRSVIQSESEKDEGSPSKTRYSSRSGSPTDGQDDASTDDTHSKRTVSGESGGSKSDRATSSTADSGPSSGVSVTPQNERPSVDVSPVEAESLPELSYDMLEKGDRIGAGGEADVYEAHVTVDGQRHLVALKEPRFEGTLHGDVLEQFQSEAETWDSLDDHDNIVTVHDWDTKPAPWLALEYMDGGNLTSKIGTVKVPEALWLAGRIAEGVHHGHRHGVAHLDLKPANVLLRDRDGDYDYPKISDWGLSKLLLEHSVSVDGISPQWGAPEQFDPQSYGDPDDYTDIYQLGAVTYALLTGNPPFDGRPREVMGKVMNEAPMPPSKLDSNIPEAVDEVVLKALAKDKDARYETVVNFRQDLDRLYESE